LNSTALRIETTLRIEDSPALSIEDSVIIRPIALGLIQLGYRAAATPESDHYHPVDSGDHYGNPDLPCNP
jgi:hypothetical protein